MDDQRETRGIGIDAFRVQCFLGALLGPWYKSLSEDSGPFTGVFGAISTFQHCSSTHSFVRHCPQFEKVGD